MTNVTNFDQLFRGTVGFDRILDVLGQTLDGNSQPAGYPPYNIEKNGEDEYRVTLAVAGFGQDDIEIEQRGNELVVTGKRPDEGERNRSYLHRGIGTRAFRRAFQVADHVKVTAASLENGLLSIDLLREIPEERRPRKIAIAGPSATVGISQADETGTKAEAA